MTISAKFAADFAAFYDAVQKAEVSLKGFESGAANVEKQLNRMADSLTGTKIIQQATLMAEAVDRIGGASKLTETELRQVGAVAEEAAEKMKALGQEVPDKIQSLADASRNLSNENKGAAIATRDLHAELSAFDGVLAALGIRLGPEVRAIGELGAAATQTVGELGAVVTAGLAIGAGIGGWKLGRAIAEFFELDQKIGAATARLLGWGDLAAEVAGAKADVLARASARVGFEVTNMADALKINEEALKGWRSAAERSAGQIAAWREEIAKVKAAGNLESLTADLASQNFELKDLSLRYGISAEALKVFANDTAKAADAEAAAAEKIKLANKTKLDALREELQVRQQVERQREQGQATIAALEREYETTRVAQSGNSYALQIAQVEAWADALAAQMKRAGADSVEFYDALAKTAAEKLNLITLRTLQSDRFTREHYELLADQAKAAYDFALDHASSYTNEEIQLRREAYREAEAMSQHWAAQASDDMARVSGASKETAASIDKITDALKRSAEAARQAGGSREITAVNFQEAIADYVTKVSGGVTGLTVEHGLNQGEALRLAKLGYSFQEIVYLLTHGEPSPLPPPGGPRIPGFAAGGYVPEDMVAQVHKGEYVVPATGGAVASTTVNFVLDGNTVASVVIDRLTGRMLQERLYPGR